MSNFKIYKDKLGETDADSTHEDETTLLYTVFGKQDWVDEEGFPRIDLEDFDPAQVHAKAVKGDERTKFYVKVGRHGKFFDPVGLYSEGTEYKQKRHAGRPEWELKNVSQKAFDFYINFLKTKNAAWLRNAERAV